MRVLRKIAFTSLPVIVLVVSFIYLCLAFQINKDIFHPTGLSYFNNLISALEKGQLNINSSTLLDLSLYQGKWYMYWGPAPLFFVLPFYLVSGILASDIFYTLVAGILNVIIFYLLVKEFIRYFSLTIPFFKQHLIVLSFAFASPNFYLSLAGRIWHTSQVISIFYLLLFYLFYFKFLNNQIKLRFFALAVIFVNLAWFSHYTLIFNLLLLLYPLGVLFKQHPVTYFKKACLIAGLTISLTFSIMFVYNKARFDNFFETGIRYVEGNLRYDNILKEGKILDLNYLGHNLTTYFAALPQFSFNSLKLNISSEGNSVFAVYPYLFLVLLLFGRKIFKSTRSRVFFLFSAGVLLLNIGTLMVYFATGWVQFGSRYFFDAIPLLFLLILFVIQKTPLPALIILLIYGFIVNLLGIQSFYEI